MKKKRKYFYVFQIVKRKKTKAKREIFLSFSILEGGNLKRKRERPNKKQKKIFLVFFNYTKETQTKKIFLGFQIVNKKSNKSN